MGPGQGALHAVLPPSHPEARTGGPKCSTTGRVPRLASVASRRVAAPYGDGESRSVCLWRVDSPETRLARSLPRFDTRGGVYGAV